MNIKKHIAENENYKYIPLDSYEEFETSDIGLAGALLVWDFELMEIRQPEPGDRAYFIFKGFEGMDQVKDSYFNDKATVPPFKFMSALRRLKSRLYNQ